MADLDAIERDWKAATRTGSSWEPSNVAIAARHGVTEGYIRKVAKKFNWQRGAAVTQPAPPPPPREYLRRSSPDTGGMDDKALADNLLRRMLDELDTVTSHIGELEDLIETETHDDRDDRRRAAMLKAVSLPVRANTLKLLLMAQAEEGGKKGKKELLQEAAVVAGKGKFKSSAPPLKVVGVQRDN